MSFKEMGFGDESLIQRVAPKFKYNTGEKSFKKRVLFITEKLVKETIHNIPDNGFLKCLAEDGPCPACEAGNYKKARYGTHILQYATDQNGSVLNPFSFQVLAFAFAKGTAEKLQTLHAGMGDQFSKLDVLVSCENTEFQQLSFMPMMDSKGSAFSQQPEALKIQMREDIKKQVAAIDLKDVISRVVTPEVMADMLSGKIKTFVSKPNPAAPVAPAVVPAASAAQAALPLTVATPITVTIDPTPAQKDAQAMMAELSI